MRLRFAIFLSQKGTSYFSVSWNAVSIQNYLIKLLKEVSFLSYMLKSVLWIFPIFFIDPDPTFYFGMDPILLYKGRKSGYI